MPESAESPTTTALTVGLCQVISDSKAPHPLPPSPRAASATHHRRRPLRAPPSKNRCCASRISTHRHRQRPSVSPSTLKPYPTGSHYPPHAHTTGRSPPRRPERRCEPRRGDRRLRAPPWLGWPSLAIGQGHTGRPWAKYWPNTVHRL
jgi:hypothetical protein